MLNDYFKHCNFIANYSIFFPLDLPGS